jgi:hypothetical protein
MAAVCNLCASTWDSKPTAEVIDHARRLEQQIRAWRPLSFNVDGPVTSAQWVERVSMQECWRLSAIILLYTLVLRVGPLHPVVRDCFKQIMGLLKTSLTLSSLLEPTSVDLPACFSVCPAFLAGSLATEPEDRQLVRHYIEGKLSDDLVYEADPEQLADQRRSGKATSRSSSAPGSSRTRSARRSIGSCAHVKPTSM